MTNSNSLIFACSVGPKTKSPRARSLCCNIVSAINHKPRHTRLHRGLLCTNFLKFSPFFTLKILVFLLFCK